MKSIVYKGQKYTAANIEDHWVLVVTDVIACKRISVETFTDKMDALLKAQKLSISEPFISIAVINPANGVTESASMLHPQNHAHAKNVLARIKGTDIDILI